MIHIRRMFPFLILFMLLVAGCRSLPNAEPVRKPQAEIIRVAKESVEGSVELTGKIEFQQSADLKWQSAGVVEKVNVREGQSVKKGDILAQLAPESLNAQILTAEKNMIDAKNELETAEFSNLQKARAFATLTANQIVLQATKQAQEVMYFPRGDRSDKENAYDEFKLAQQNFEYAKEDYRTVLENYKGWDDDARTTYFDSYQSAYNELKSKYEKWKWMSSGPNEVDLAAAEGAVLSAQKDFNAALEAYGKPVEDDISLAKAKANDAENQFEKRYLIAPFAGVVSTVFNEAGDSVKDKQTGIHLDNRAHIYVSTEINELDLGKIRTGQTATVILDADPQKKYSGKVTLLSETGEKKNGNVLFHCKVELDEPDALIKSGMTARVVLSSRNRFDVIRVPESAIVTENGEDYVYRMESGKPVKARVETGTRASGMVEILSGLESGQEILKEGRTQ